MLKSSWWQLAKLLLCCCTNYQYGDVVIVVCRICRFARKKKKNLQATHPASVLPAYSPASQISWLQFEIRKMKMNMSYTKMNICVE